MKITSVKTAASDGHCMHLWVKIETDAGITGLGECVHGGYQAIAGHITAGTVVRSLLCLAR